jgi:hypothetical protein
LFPFQALRVISEVGDLLKLKYSTKSKDAGFSESEKGFFAAHLVSIKCGHT